MCCRSQTPAAHFAFKAKRTLSKTVAGARSWRPLLARLELMSTTTAPGLRRSFNLRRKLSDSAGTSILWLYWSAGKLREAGAFVEAGDGEDQKIAADI
jgi:hypothetical protein